MNVICPKCQSGFVCSNCEYPLWKVESATHSTEIISAAVRPISQELRSYLTALRFRSPYVPTFSIGPRGGAMIDFGNMIRLECYLPYADEEGLLPFLPMPLVGDIVHDAAHSDRRKCELGICDCERPVGWRLTRPILRALFGVTDAFLNEHSGELPGRLPGWRLAVDTLTFMRECYFNPEFQFPTRESSRAARRAQHERRGRAVRASTTRRESGTRKGSVRKPPPPHGRNRKS